VPNRFYKLSNGTCCSRALGFEEVTASAGTLGTGSPALSVYQLQTPQNTIGSLFGHALDGSSWPNNTELLGPDFNYYTWNGSTWIDESTGNPANNVTLSLGDGYGVINHAANPLTATVAGLVPEGYLTKTIRLVPYSDSYAAWLAGSLVPQAGPLVSVLGYEPVEGDIAQLWGNGDWESEWFIYSGGFWYDNLGFPAEEPFVQVGQTVFIEAGYNETRNWARTHSVCY
jgi:hypothetical protein